MELKCINNHIAVGSLFGSNRTFMELKCKYDMYPNLME